MLTNQQASLIVVGIYLAFGVAELVRTRLFSKNEQTRDDGILEIISTFTLLAITQPTIGLGLVV